MAWSKQSRHERGYGSAHVKRAEIVKARDQYLCQACLRQGRVTAVCRTKRDHAVDHIIPKASGGTDDLTNLELLCAACHEAKTARETAEAQGRRPRRTIGEDGWPIG